MLVVDPLRVAGSRSGGSCLSLLNQGLSRQLWAVSVPIHPLGAAGWVLGCRDVSALGVLPPQHHFPGFLVLFGGRLMLPQFPLELERGVCRSVVPVHLPSVLTSGWSLFHLPDGAVHITPSFIPQPPRLLSCRAIIMPLVLVRLSGVNVL